MKPINCILATFVVLMIPAYSASIILYSQDFTTGGSSSIQLNGTAVDSTGATASQHTQYGTTNGATWSAQNDIFTDGSVTGESAATLAFTPQDGYVYTVTMTTDYASDGGYYAVGFVNSATNVLHHTRGVVWGLTRPGHGTHAQVGHYKSTGGTGSVGNAVYDTTTPSTIFIELDTTNASDWVATWSFSNTAGGITELASQSVNGSAISGVGISNYARSSGDFQSFELSVAVPEPSSAILSIIGLLLLLRRQRHEVE